MLLVGKSSSFLGGQSHEVINVMMHYFVNQAQKRIHCFCPKACVLLMQKSDILCLCEMMFSCDRIVHLIVCMVDCSH